jgi:voltage-gated potassium channel Kch
MMRLGRLVARVQDQLQIKFSALVVYKFILLFVVAVHWLGCAFYFFTSIEEESQEVWFKHYLNNTEAGVLSKRSKGEIYIACIYWAITTMTTTGYGDIIPTTMGERLVFMVAMVLGAVGFAYALSNMTSIVFNFNKYEVGHSSRVDDMNEYVVRQGNIRSHIGI